jgi:hypothetical protein
LGDQDPGTVSPLFGNKKDKAQEEAAAGAEASRLASLTASELAAEIMPAFGPEGPGRGQPPELNFIQVANWLMRSHRGGTAYLRDLERPVRASIQALEVAGLVQHRGQSGRLSPTAAGEAALIDGSVSQRLAGS